MPRKTRTKKKEKKNIANGVVHIQSTFNNTIITITDTTGNVISWSSAGGSFDSMHPYTNQGNPAVLSSIFFVGGALFGYFIVFPYGFDFFLGFATETIRPMPSMKEYLSFSAKLLLAFGLVFELPLVITFLARLGIVSVPFLKKNRKYALLLFFVGAAILTPPDVVTQVMMAGPLMVLYEISIVGARIFGRKEKPAESAADAEGAEDS